jgi:hypothetical protein
MQRSSLSLTISDLGPSGMRRSAETEERASGGGWDLLTGVEVGDGRWRRGWAADGRRTAVAMGDGGGDRGGRRRRRGRPADGRRRRTAARRLRLGSLGEVAGWWGGAMGRGGLAAGNPKIVCIYIRVLRPTCHRVWRVCGFGYQFFKSVRKYPLGLELYPRPCPRAQIQTRIRAHRVWYPRVRGYFVPVAIFRQHGKPE